jgi:hypothetical protein
MKLKIQRGEDIKRKKNITKVVFKLEYNSDTYMLSLFHTFWFQGLYFYVLEQKYAFF